MVAFDGGAGVVAEELVSYVADDVGFPFAAEFCCMGDIPRPWPVPVAAPVPVLDDEWYMVANGSSYGQARQTEHKVCIGGSVEESWGWFTMLKAMMSHVCWLSKVVRVILPACSECTYPACHSR